MKKLIVLLMLLSGSCAFAILTPGAYMPFENDSGAYGMGSEGNPAWNNIGPATPERVKYIGSAVGTTFAKIGTVDGVKGSYEKITGFGTPGVDTFQTLNYRYSVVTDVMSQAKSYTFTMWVNTRDAASTSPGKYLFHQQGGSGATAGPSIKWGNAANDGRIGLYLGGAFQWTPAGTVVTPANTWDFLAMTVDSTTGTASLYSGTKTSAVSLVATWTGLNISQLPVLTANTAANSFVLNGFTYNGSDKYAGYDMDEFRAYSSKTDGSGALGLNDIEAIRQFDIPEPATIGLLSLGMTFFARKRK